MDPDDEGGFCDEWPDQWTTVGKPRAELQPHDLCRAALQGDIRLAGWALERHNPDAEAKKGWTALHLAAAGGHQDIARALLKQQAQVDQAMPVSALSLACLTGKRDVVELLISALAQLDGPDGNGGAPLLHAAYKNRLPICQLLLDSDASAQVSFGPAGASRLAPVRRLRGEGGEGSPRWQEVLCESGFTRLEELQYCEGITALHLAAWHGNASLCLALLDAHARPNAQDSVGRTAISLAAQRGHLQSTMLLLEHRAQPQTADATGSTAVGWAAKMGQKPVVELLLEKMSIDFVPWLGAPTMLHLAAYHGRQGVVAMLLAQHANTDVSLQPGGIRPLMVAAFQGSAEICQLLISSHAHVNQKDEEGATAWQYAALAGHDQVCELLVTFGAVELD
ncbi:unnamed protein product [Durusdinium trenchii]|uniref:Uncharacterized protein n=1 Tax=Durusdinium trenchii TaxID=1381693 RepID=A0ABP0SSB2_9DINO